MTIETGTMTRTAARGKLRIRTRHFVLPGLVVLVVLGWMFSRRRDLTKVQVVSPEYQDLETTVSTVGTVVPLDEFPARANFSGMVENIDVQLGQKVHPGQLLVTMKDQYALPRLEQAKATLDAAQVGEQAVEQNGSAAERVAFAADVEKAQTEQKNAAASLATMRELLARGSASQAEMDAARQRLETANASLASLEQQDKKRYSAKDLASAQDKVKAAQASYDAEKVSYGNAYVTSPIAGTVYTIPIARYDFVPAGSDLLRVADLRHIQIHADFDEPDVARLHDGQPVKITWDGKPTSIWHGRVLHAPMAVTAAGARNIGMCTISVEDATGDLPADSHVTVVVTTGVRHHVVTVPREAMHMDGEKRYVYRVVDGKLARTPVTLGLVSIFRAEVTSGLTDRDLVVMHSLHGESLASGDRVAPVR